MLLFPNTILVEDYHDLAALEGTLNALCFKRPIAPASTKIRVKELCFDDRSGKYMGLVYLRGKKPTKSEIRDLIAFRQSEPVAVGKFFGN